jgi:hypothetical protein
VLQDVLDLDGTIKGQSRKLGVHGASHTQRMGWSIQEVRITKGNVLRPRLHEPPDIFQNNFLGNSEKPPTVDRWNGTMQAEMLTATAGFDIADQAASAVAI